jgi:hypothetical protein
MNYICVDRDVSGLITDVLRSRVVTLVLKIYFTIIMYPDCSSTQICLKARQHKRIAQMKAEQHKCLSKMIVEQIKRLTQITDGQHRRLAQRKS